MPRGTQPGKHILQTIIMNYLIFAFITSSTRKQMFCTVPDFVYGSLNKGAWHCFSTGIQFPVHTATDFLSVVQKDSCFSQQRGALFPRLMK